VITTSDHVSIVKITW